MISRRQFLALTGTGLVSAALWPFFKQFRTNKVGTLLGGGQYVDPSTNKLHNVFVKTHLNKKLPTLITVDFFPHGIAIDPNNISRLIAFEKIGPGACEIDLTTNKVVRTLPPKDGCFFYGHGVFSKQGDVLFSTETYLDSHAGTITIRDHQSLDIIDEFPSHGANPHDCQLFDNGKIMAITNGGGEINSTDRPCVTYVEVSSGKLLEKIELANPLLNTGHLQVTNNRDLIVISAPRLGLSKHALGGINFRHDNQAIQIAKPPEKIIEKMQGESLSVAVHEASNTAAVTTPDGNLMTFWNLNTQKFIKALQMPRPRGVTLSIDNKFFIVSYGHDASLMLISTDQLLPIANSSIANSYISGSHLFNWEQEIVKINS